MSDFSFYLFSFFLFLKQNRMVEYVLGMWRGKGGWGRLLPVGGRRRGVRV
jgi:hypothetical protein